ncbi:hypothetical protein PR048_010040 [Dryococelus australis]|uniref:Uncharacterized protein n=1 Tax=Dryococelus australis TaxID=614101 RepID=A0ABQ9I1L9_9NEOP|nr:hypothetical protein PR048_010040 [Dryococelus australis]
MWCKHPEGMSNTFKDIGRLESLEKLIYAMCKSMTDDDAEQMARFRNLKHLELVGCDQLTDKTFTHMANCKYLEYLNLRCCTLSEQVLHMFPEQFYRLGTLRLDSETITSKALDALAEKMPSLRIH